MNNISSWGDCGDICCLMTLARSLGKASILVSDNPMCKPITRPDRFNAIKPLVESQSYIERFDIWSGEKITHDAATFRSGGIEYGQSLAQLHANWVGIEISLDPWLTIEPNNQYKGKIVINRSARHWNPLFPWRDVLQHFKGDDLVFIGLPDEHIMLQNEYGVKLPRIPTDDLLQCAQIIAASKLFIGNQSSCANLALGMGHPMLLETSITSLDCVLPRDNVHYCVDGEIKDLKVKGYASLSTPCNIPDKELDLTISPPGQTWIMEAQDGTQFQDFSAHALLRIVAQYEREKGLALSTVRDLTNQTAKRHPTFGGSTYNNRLRDQTEAAKAIIKKVTGK